MYYIKRFIFQLISRSVTLTKILHFIWIKYQYLRCNFKSILFYRLDLKLNSLSDRGQDKWVIDIFDLNTKNYRGFFLEIGAGDGFCNSNTFILEKNYGWDGVLIEASAILFNKLREHRSGSKMANYIIYDENVKIKFLENGELSKVAFKNDGDTNYTELSNTKKLVDVLNEFHVPKTIDFFSLDVEGSEEKVLTQEVLNEYTFLALCVERPSKKLFELLVKNEYVFVESRIYDCFFVKKSFLNLEKIKIKKFINFELK